MSSKSKFSACMTIGAPVDVIVGVLSSTEHYSDWNPALTYVGPAGDDGVHPVVVHRVWTGNLTRVISEKSVRLTIAIPGLVENSTFDLEEVGSVARVTHTIDQNGLLVRIIGPQEASLVPGKRLTRLANILSDVTVARDGKREFDRQ